MAGKGYYVRDETGRYLGKSRLVRKAGGARPFVDSPEEAALFPTKLEADECRKMYAPAGKLRVEKAG